MPVEKTILLYQYDELPTEKAKQKAREWFVSGDTVDMEDSMETFRTVCSIIGLEIHTKNGRDEINYELGSSQGDCVTFAGSLSPATNALEKMREEFPQSEELHSIADRIQELSKGYLYDGELKKVEASISCTHRYPQLTISAEDEIISPHVDDVVQDLQNWAFKMFRENYEYQLSEENVAENIRINEYTFREDGSRESS